MEAAGDPSGRLKTRSGRTGWHQTFQPQQQMLTGLIKYKVTPENCFVFNKHLKLEEEWFFNTGFLCNKYHSKARFTRQLKTCRDTYKQKNPNHELLICFRKRDQKIQPSTLGGLHKNPGTRRCKAANEPTAQSWFHYTAGHPYRQERGTLR